MTNKKFKKFYYTDVRERGWIAVQITVRKVKRDGEREREREKVFVCVREREREKERERERI